MIPLSRAPKDVVKENSIYALSGQGLDVERLNESNAKSLHKGHRSSRKVSASHYFKLQASMDV